MKKEERIARILGDWRESQGRGDARDPEEIVRAHPDLADELRARFVALHVMEQLFAEPDIEAQQPQMIGNYRLVREIGRGGMGVVYEAVQVNMERRVALKVLSVTITGTPQAVKRFQREAKAAGRLHHTNIVPVHDLDHCGGQWYYVMELVEGQPLSDVVAQLKALGERPSEEDLARLATREHPGTAVLRGTGTGDRAYFIRVANMFAAVAEALELAHQEGITHRDIKPSNLLLDADGVLKIVDFGLARFDDERLSMTATGDLLGTPLYMSPEQAMAKRITLDHRTDIYSLGATLYELLTLRPPFEAKDLAHLCSQIITKDPVLPRRASPRIPRDLETIVCKAMEKDRDKRYQTARELARDLRRFADGMAIEARRIRPWGRAWRKVKRHKVRSSLAAAVLLLGVAGAVFGIRSVREAHRRALMEYTALCGEGYVARVQAGPEDLDHMIELANGVQPVEYFSQAIELLPDRAEAYLGRALLDERTTGERLADLEEALARGLAARSYHLARAEVFRREGDWDRVYEEERLAGGRGSAAPLDLLVEGRLLFARGEHADAEQLLAAAIEASEEGSPVRFLAHRIRAHVRRETGDFEGVLEDLLAVRAGGDRTPATEVRIADLWRALGRPEKGEAEFAVLLDRLRSGDSADAWFSACTACLFTDPASTWLDRLSGEGLRRHPDSPRLLVARAWCCNRRRDAEAAIDLVDRALALRPDYALAYNARGNAALAQRRAAEALADLERGLRLEPRSRLLESNRLYVLTLLGRYEEALAGADEALRRHPYHAGLHVLRGDALRGLARHGEALEAYDRALELEPRSCSAYLNRAIDLEALGQRDEALESNERAVELWPACHGAHEHLACLLLRMGRPREALAAYDRALELDPGCTNSWHDRASALLDVGRAEEALASVDRALELRPGDARSEATRAAVLQRLGRKDEARAALERVLELDPENIVAQVSRGVMLLHDRRFEQALAAFELVLRRLAEDPGLFVHLSVISRSGGQTEDAQRALLAAMQQNRGSALFGLGRNEEALQVFDDALELAPDMAYTHHNRGLALSALRRLPQALEAFNRAVELDPNHASSHENRGCTLYALQRLAEALEAFDRTLELEPGLARVHVNRGLALAALGHHAQAVEAYDRALEIDSESPFAHTNRGNALSALGRHAEALEAHDRELLRDPQSAGALANRGNALRMLGHNDEALQAYERSIRLDRRQGSVYHNYGAALADAGRTKEALLAFERAYELGFRRDPQTLNQVAWVRATAADPSLRNPSRAVELARAATGLVPREGAAWNTLGVALCRTKEWSKAIPALERSMELRNGGDAFDWFFVAMAHWHLGEKDKARQWHDKAVAWMEERQPDDQELKRFRAEAEEVLGITDGE
jgi:tetratricopeptide (TPR) repeat protein/serine/threonine protein kinase